MKLIIQHWPVIASWYMELRDADGKILANRFYPSWGEAMAAATLAFQHN